MINKLKNIDIDKRYMLVFGLILLVAFTARIINLNYNTPFVDESSSIIIGMLGVFQGDWWSYNASSWMSGSPYINPVLSSITYISGGIFGSRLLNVILGVLTIEIVAVIAILLSGLNSKRAYLVGIITAIILSFSPVSVFVSRMATYDIKSFYLFFLSILLLLWAEKSETNKGKWYFLSSISLMLAFMSKIIIAIYIPIIGLYSLWISYGNKKQFYYWTRYYFAPLALFAIIYLISFMSSVLDFAKLQSTKESIPVIDILIRIYNDMRMEIWWGVVGFIGLFFSKKYWKLAFALLFCSIWILLSHIVTQKALWTMDKHIFITISFISIAAGIGLSNIIYFLNSRSFRFLGYFTLSLYLLSYSFLGYKDSLKYNTLWENSTKVLSFLKNNTVSGDKILTEIGTTSMLDIYPINSPLNTTTFDWFQYQGFSGFDAYNQASKDGYFDTILLINSSKPKSDSLKKVSDIVRYNISGIYNLAYSDSDFEVYKQQY